MVASGDVVIQGGADMGWKQEKFSASNVFKISKIIGKKGKLFVIEPDLNNFRALEEFIRCNELNNIICIHKAIWSSQTKLKFMIGKRSNDSQLSEYLKDVSIQIDKYWESEYEIDTITLDRLYKDYKINKLDFICLTINGAEYEALQGASIVLNKFSPKLYIAANHKTVRSTINSEPYSEVITRLLKNKNYSVHKDRKGWLFAKKDSV
jgi:FkbM family methyltransferase